MPSHDKHTMKYNENKDLLNTVLNIEESKHYNWIVTVAFYAAVHLVEGEMADNSLHTTSHTDRNINIERFNNFINIRSAYKNLYSQSIIARYEGCNMNKQKAIENLECLKLIEDELIHK